MRPLIGLRHADVAPRRDPAPSRVAYRLQRLWLTPVFRTAMRVGLPAFLLAMCVGLYLSDDQRRAGLGTVVTDLRDRVKNRPEFTVTQLAVDGASPALAEEVRRVLALTLPQSSFDLDLDAARTRVAALDAVSDVGLRIEPGGVLGVKIVERIPALVFRDTGGLVLVDASGHRVTGLNLRSDRADLPLMTGEGADGAAPEALQLIAAAGPLMPRLRGLVRMGDRRWDLVLDRDQRILLPVQDPVRSLERLIALDQGQDLLARDLTVVDLRLQDRPTLRLAPFALTEARRARGILPPEPPSAETKS